MAIPRKPSPLLELLDTAANIAAKGPVKHEPVHRRLRGLVCGEWLFDTMDAKYVWEQVFYPYFYVPKSAIEAGPGKLSIEKEETIDSEKGKGMFWLGTISLRTKSFVVAGFSSGPLKGFVKIPVSSIESWFAEDEKLLGPHPKDPYKRIECLSSSREVRIEVGGVVIARSTNNIFLHETSLRTRYYLPATSVLDWKMLSPSDTWTFCPYKGQADYYDLTVPCPEELKGKFEYKVIQDAVCVYTYPRAESAQILNLLCFFNEKVDIFIDGVLDVDDSVFWDPPAV
ncbi:hypothetical protein B0T17DRAFT_543869 [Bombardia bombarda]|uniref:DUF427 domain-containing protein n=1 Tax=Bombardia bombarda TaxID=252184 RepID=A0AA39TMA6_9PEZI|nr:hypothetical protein B0T17DRAFT_543869 [Bombardia bombarda]